MKVIDFFIKTIDGKLTLSEQKRYLKTKPFPEPAELAEAALYLRAQMPSAPNLPGAIDVCGTGGSGLKRINTSTISAFLLAASGVPVAKHGNNASSGKFGSFDLLEVLDVPTSLSPQELQLRFHEYNLAFLYAKSFYPVMRHFGPVRAELKKPTFFNILGPLLSPVDAKNQIIGTPKIENARLIAEVAKELGKDRVIVVSGSDGLDEITLCGITHVVELNGKKITEYDIAPADFGVEPAIDFSEIASETPQENVVFAQNILSGRDKSRRTDLVLINSAVALCLAGKAGDYRAGYRLAKKVLKTGSAYETLENYRRPSVLTKIINQKRTFKTKNVKGSTLHGYKHGYKYKGGLIAEIKKRSPSEGEIAPDKDIVKLAVEYEKAGAAAISVLTEPHYFGGSFDDLAKIRKAVKLPILCKDFIVGKEHIDAAKNSGADMVLLIAAMLPRAKLKELFDYAAAAKLQALVEIHNQSDLNKALALNPKIIGINSRNLHDFSLHPEVFEKLRSQIPQEITVVAESGIENSAGVPDKFDGILVGTVLMKHPFPKLKIKELSSQPIIKLCGIRAPEQAALCEKLGVDMVGINLVGRSRRKVTLQTARDIALQCKDTISVGIFENQLPVEVNKLAKEVGVDAIQLSGREEYLDGYELPMIKTIKPGQTRPKQAFLSIIDSDIPGSGQAFEHSQIGSRETSLIAGGTTPETAKKIQIAKNPLGFDMASSIETNGEVDLEKIRAFGELFA
ncbi:anthranilate phosphoribosyltransferase [Candidatus Parcubacteria bacterium]|nr:anthranilate phosphoribosyltransferase [Candidatus Parcubacteria bacterium]